MTQSDLAKPLRKTKKTKKKQRFEETRPEGWRLGVRLDLLENFVFFVFFLFFPMVFATFISQPFGFFGFFGYFQWFLLPLIATPLTATPFGRGSDQTLL